MNGKKYGGRKTNYKQNWMKFADFDKESRTILFYHYKGCSNSLYHFKNKNDQTSSEYQNNLHAGNVYMSRFSLDPSPYVRQQKSYHTGYDDLPGYSKAIKAWTWRSSKGLVERFNLKTLK